jgi:hypothetical protein
MTLRRVAHARIKSLTFLVRLGRPGVPCDAIGCPQRRMLYCGYQQRWQDAMCCCTVLLQPIPDCVHSLAAHIPERALLEETVHGEN